MVENAIFRTTTPIETLDKTKLHFSHALRVTGLAIGSFGPVCSQIQKRMVFVQLHPSHTGQIVILLVLCGVH